MLELMCQENIMENAKFKENANFDSLIQTRVLFLPFISFQTLSSLLIKILLIKCILKRPSNTLLIGLICGERILFNFSGLQREIYEHSTRRFGNFYRRDFLKLNVKNN